MRRTWNLRPDTRKLAAAVLVAASLVVVMAAQAGASQQAGRASQAAPESVLANIYLNGDCYIDGSWVRASMFVSSNEYGTGYVNIYKRTRSGNVLVARATRSGKVFNLYANEPRQSGYSYFTTYGFNATTSSKSGGDNC